MQTTGSPNHGFRSTRPKGPKTENIEDSLWNENFKRATHQSLAALATHQSLLISWWGILKVKIGWFNWGTEKLQVCDPNPRASFFQNWGGPRKPYHRVWILPEIVGKIDDNLSETNPCTARPYVRCNVHCACRKQVWSTSGGLKCDIVWRITPANHTRLTVPKGQAEALTCSKKGFRTN